MHPRRTPAFQRSRSSGDRFLLGLLAIEQGAAGARDRQLEIAARPAHRVRRADAGRFHHPRRTGRDASPPFTSGSARRRTKSTLKRNRSSWSRVAAATASGLPLDVEQARHETAHVRRHRHDQVRQRNRRPRRIGIPADSRPSRATARRRPKPLLRRIARTATRDARGREGRRTCIRKRREACWPSAKTKSDPWASRTRISE